MYLLTNIVDLTVKKKSLNLTNVCPLRSVAYLRGVKGYWNPLELKKKNSAAKNRLCGSFFFWKRLNGLAMLNILREVEIRYC